MFKLAEEFLEHEESLLSDLLDSDEEDGDSCLHFLLESTPGALHPEEPHQCERCQRSRADLGSVLTEDCRTLHHGLPVLT